MVKIINDIHANRELLDDILNNFEKNDILVINGDLAGSRGEVMSKVARIFYEVRNGEAKKSTLEAEVSKITKRKITLSNGLVYGAIHAGTFQKCLIDNYNEIREITEKETYENLDILRDFCVRAKERSSEIIIYIPGNNEIIPFDLDITNGVNKEVTLEPKNRYYSRLATRGIFRKMGVFYGNSTIPIGEETITIPIDYIDLWMMGKVKKKYPFKNVKRVIAHYPPYDRKILRKFKKLMNYEENELGKSRMKAVSEILEMCPDLEMVIFGHIHRGITKKDLEKLPETIEFETGKYLSVWNRPGHIYRLDNL